MKKPALQEKALLNPEEAILLSGLNRRRFRALINGSKNLSFVLTYNKRKLIVRSVFEANPKIMEELKRGRSSVSQKA